MNILQSIIDLDSITSNSRMSFTSIHFLLFFPLVLLVVYVLPQKAQKVWILIASLYFYFFAAPSHMPILIAVVLVSYFAGLLIEVTKDKALRLTVTIASVGICIVILCFFKYSKVFKGITDWFMASINLNIQESWFTVAAAIGISFYTFTAIGYLVDVYQGQVSSEKNILNYMLFMTFFPSVTQGPILRATDQLTQFRNFSLVSDPKRIADGLRLIGIGFFKKMAIADSIGVYVSAVYSDLNSLASYQGISLIAAAIMFSLQLYFDFSGYSDIAQGSAQLLNIDIPQNFKNPYFATNFSTFWQRWHISLSTWLNDYVFKPLVWSRWTAKLPIIGKNIKNPPVLSSILIVFMLSGVWHGDTINFVIWGLMQAIFRIGEEFLHRFIGKPSKHLRLPYKIAKTSVVFILWTESLVFFALGLYIPEAPISTGFITIFRQFNKWSTSQLATDIYAAVEKGIYNQDIVVGAFMIFAILCLTMGIWADWFQAVKLKGASLAICLGKTKARIKNIIYFIIVLSCFIAFIFQSGYAGGANFLYGGL